MIKVRIKGAFHLNWYLKTIIRYKCVQETVAPPNMALNQPAFIPNSDAGTQQMAIKWPHIYTYILIQCFHT